MQISETDQLPALEYTISLDQTDQIIISRDGVDDLITNDLGKFIFLFEKDITIELQKIRSDLVFIHSAALEYNGAGLLLVAPSGTGKSTTTWGLINTGFNYLSDELAPIDLDSMMVYPYPHAINLKAKPPIYELPEECLFTSQTIHVHGDLFSKAVHNKPVLLKAIVFLEYHPEISDPEILEISRGEAAAKLYSNSLNILAHSNSDYGLNAAVQIVTKAQTFKLLSNHLDQTCETLKSLIQSLN